MRHVAAEGMDPLYADQAMKSKPSPRHCTCNNVSGDSLQFNSNLPCTECLAPCVVCQQQHILFQCDSFKAMHPQARFDLVMSKKLCFLCHFAKDCRKQYTSSILGCGKRHTKFIHVDNQCTTSIAPPVHDDFIRGSCNENRGHVSGEHYRGSVNVSNASANAELSNVYLPIVPVTVNGDAHTYYALLDSGSTNSFISETAASHLSLQSDSIRYNISTISNQSSVDKLVSFAGCTRHTRSAPK